MAQPSDDDGHKPQFFKVLLPGFSKKLTIPRAFHKYITKDEHRRATILSPLEGSWHVSVHQDAQGMYFREGWQEFAQAHELCLGYFVVFGYHGNMVFSFKAFDLSACEKEYINPEACNCTKYKKTKRDQDQNSQSVCESFSRRQVKVEVEVEVEPLVRATKACEQPKNGKVLEKKSSQFMVVISSSNLTQSYMNIPFAFMKTCNIGLLTKSEMSLRDPKGKLWPVRLHHRRLDRVSRHRTQIAKGWLEFAIANQLRKGDNCLFELVIEEKDIVMNVRLLER